MLCSSQISATARRVIPLQHVGVGARHAAVLDDEDVVARPLGQRAVGADQDRIVAAMVVGLEAGLHEVRPVVVLAAGVDRLGGHPFDGAEMEGGAVAAFLLAPDPDIGDGVGHERGLAEARVAGLVRDHAARELDLHIAVLQPRPGHAFGEDAARLVGTVGVRQPEPGAGSGETFQVLVEHEEPAGPGGRHVVDGIPPDEADVEDRHPGVLGRHIRAVDEHASLGHRSLTGQRIANDTTPRARPAPGGGRTGQPLLRRSTRPLNASHTPMAVRIEKTM